MEILFENDWMKIIKQDDNYIIQYNSGDLIDSTQEIIVSETDAIKAQESSHSAYEVVIKYQNMQRETNPPKQIIIEGLD